MTAPKPQPDDDDGKHRSHVLEQPAAVPPSSPEEEATFADGSKLHPRRRPGITDLEEFMRIQKAWESKLPLDEDPTTSHHAYTRPVRSHTHATMRKLISNDTLIKVQRKYDWSWDGFRRYVERNQRMLNLKRQRFISLRHGVLGPDLATAHFITHRGGRVKFVGHSEWFTDDEPLPKKFDDNYLIEKVDATSELFAYFAGY